MTDHRYQEPIRVASVGTYTAHLEVPESFFRCSNPASSCRMRHAKAMIWTALVGVFLGNKIKNRWTCKQPISQEQFCCDISDRKDRTFSDICKGIRADCLNLLRLLFCSARMIDSWISGCSFLNSVKHVNSSIFSFSCGY